MTTRVLSAAAATRGASALVKLYLPEPESGQVNRLVQGRRDLMVILADLDGDLFQRADLTPSTHREAERLLLSWARCRCARPTPFISLWP